MTDSKKTHWTPVEDKPEKKVKAKPAPGETELGEKGKKEVKEAIKAVEKGEVKTFDNAEDLIKELNEPVNLPGHWHGWATPEQVRDMMDEMIKFLTDGGHPCPFKRE